MESGVHHHQRTNQETLNPVFQGSYRGHYMGTMDHITGPG